MFTNFTADSFFIYYKHLCHSLPAVFRFAAFRLAKGHQSQRKMPSFSG